MEILRRDVTGDVVPSAVTIMVVGSGVVEYTGEVDHTVVFAGT